MRQMIRHSALIFTVAYLASPIADANDNINEKTTQPFLKGDNDHNYARNGHSFYFYGGYLYTYRFLNNTPQALNYSNTILTYTPSTISPNSFNGIQLGIGKELMKRIDFQLSYIQHFLETKSGVVSGTPFYTRAKMNGFLANFGYVFNPDNQIQIMPKIGLAVAQFYEATTLAGTPYYNDETKTGLALGVDILFQIRKKVGIRFGSTYLTNTTKTIRNGEIDTLIGLNYIL